MTVCIACLDGWVDETLLQVRQTAIAVQIRTDDADLDIYEMAQELLEHWELEKMIPMKAHECAAGRCLCRCREVACA